MLNRLIPVLAAAVMFAACGSSSSKTPPKAAEMKEQTTASKAKSFAKSTPPTGATSMGMMSSPQQGKLTIPVQNVEVYVFTSDLDGNSSQDTLYWAADSSAAYVWGSIALDCVDESGVATGETGTADFALASAESGYGWMIATDACGYSTAFGCSGTSAADEVCGGCDWNGSFIACAAQ